MSAEVFVDTNVLVYAYDRRDPAKQATAQSILREGVRRRNVVLSAQVLGEFFAVVTRKIAQPMTAEQALRVIRLLASVSVVPIDAPLVFKAVVHSRDHRISYWGGLIVAAAERAGCVRVLSEDLNSGHRYGSVTVENPFVSP
jgi:predicted nucleic acid-binding protein